MRTLAILIAISLTIGTSASAGPLSDAAKNGDLEEVERLLAMGEDANDADSVASALHWAALNGHDDIVALLVEHGAEFGAQSVMLGTPLHAAASRNQDAVVAALLDAGADPDVRDRNQFTPLMLVAFHGRADAAFALIAAGADVDAVGIAPRGQHLGKGPTNAFHLALRMNNAEIAERLREAGAKAVVITAPDGLLAEGDAEKGRELAYTYCEECHPIEAGEAPRMNVTAGPSLVGIFNREVADQEGFEYSSALIAHGGTWTADRLYAFALSPMLTVPGTYMNWAPDRTPEMIADIVAYLEAASK